MAPVAFTVELFEHFAAASIARMPHGHWCGLARGRVDGDALVEFELIRVFNNTFRNQYFVCISYMAQFSGMVSFGTHLALR